jgi:hypothetical protein
MSQNPNSLKNLRHFQPGNKMGQGVVKLPPELRQARRENMASLIRLIHQYVGMTENQAKERLNGPESLQIEEMIQGQINKAKEGDSNSFKFIIEVMCGKIPESDESKSTTENMTRQEKLAAARLMVQMLEQDPNGSSDV